MAIAATASEWGLGSHVLVDDADESCGYITRRLGPDRYLLTPGADDDPNSFEAVSYGAPSPDGLPVITQWADVDHDCPHDEEGDADA